jgi:hypothetical protein
MSRQSRPNAAKLALLVSVIILSAIAMSADAYAIGVTPGRKTMDFAPGLEQSITFTILNNENKEFRALVYAEGDLKDYVYADRSIVEFTAGKASEQFTYRIRLPESISEPGEHWAKIVVVELPPEQEGTDGSLILATTAVIHQLKVDVPYPGKFATAELSVADVKAGQPVSFLVKVLNVGEQDIASAWATIDILGPTNERIATVETGSSGVKAKNIGELTAVWDARVNPGTYHAVATVHYDDKVTRAEKNFGVGNMMIDILGVSVKEFRLGGVAKFNIEVESKWSERIGGVYAEMDVLDSNGDSLANFKSASADLEPMARSTLYAYWDTDSVERGEYDILLKLHYAGKVNEKMISTYVGFDSIETSLDSPVTGKAVSYTGDAAASDISMYIILLVAVLIGINGFWFLKLRGRKQ